MSHPSTRSLNYRSRPYFKISQCCSSVQHRLFPDRHLAKIDRAVATPGTPAPRMHHVDQHDRAFPMLAQAGCPHFARLPRRALTARQALKAGDKDWRPFSHIGGRYGPWRRHHACPKWNNFCPPVWSGKGPEQSGGGRVTKLFAESQIKFHPVVICRVVGLWDLCLSQPSFKNAHPF